MVKRLSHLEQIHKEIVRALVSVAVVVSELELEILDVNAETSEDKAAVLVATQEHLELKKKVQAFV